MKPIAAVAIATYKPVSVNYNLLYSPIRKFVPLQFPIDTSVHASSLGSSNKRVAPVVAIVSDVDDEQDICLQSAIADIDMACAEEESHDDEAFDIADVDSEDDIDTAVSLASIQDDIQREEDEMEVPALHDACEPQAAADLDLRARSEIVSPKPTRQFFPVTIRPRHHLTDKDHIVCQSLARKNLSEIEKTEIDEMLRLHNKKRRSNLIKLDLDAIMLEMAEIAYCCGSPARVPIDHAFSSPVVLIRRRLLFKSTALSTRQYLMTSMRNRSHDPAGKSAQHQHRVITLEGLRVCHTCFMAFAGVSERLLRKVHKEITLGRIECGDYRNMSLALPSILKKTLMVSLLAMVDEGYGQTLPTPEGTVSNQYIEFPYTQWSALAQELAFFMMKRDKGNEVDVGLFQKSYTVSLTTLNRAITALKEERDILISVAKTKKFMRCDTCAKFDEMNQKATSMEARSEVHMMRSDHMQQIKTERAQYEKIRDRAK